MPELDALREKLLAKLNVGERRLNQLILHKEGETLFPRRQAILALAAENGLSIRRFASEDDLSQLRGSRQSSKATDQAASSAGSSADGVTSKHGARRSSNKRRITSKPKGATRGRKVFVVHGRNDRLRKALFSFLRSLNLEPLEWRKAIAATGKATPMVAEILDAAFEQAVAIVVLLTPDDRVTLASVHRKSSDPPYESRIVGQARPNVLFEAGMAFGKNPNATVMVQVGDVKPFSDIGGRHVTRLGNDPESRSEVVTKLSNAGCAVDDNGSDWYTEGDFALTKEEMDGAT
jgi:predicted nucleotide-binding protein